MKRDMDLIRDILLAIKRSDAGYFDANSLALPGYTSEAVNYHLGLLIDAGLVEGTGDQLLGSAHPEWAVERLTWDGHEFLDAARNDTTWEKAKAIMIEKTGGISLEVMKHLLIELGKGALGMG